MAAFPESTDKDIDESLKVVRSTFREGRTLPVEYRKGQLRAMQRMLEENADKIHDALHKDLGTNRFFSQEIEIGTVAVELKTCLANLDDWVKPVSASTPLLMLPGSSYVVPEPYGVVLIIAPWNYPVSLVLVPMLTAIAAGNTVVVKPSELSVNVSLLLEKLCKMYLDSECVRFVQGAVAPTTYLLTHKFDFIMYTGHGHVARIVSAAAAKNLTPVLLELGGKCPAIVTSKCSLKKTCERLVWGKYTMNMGQTCLTVDYILTTEDMVAKLIQELKKTLAEFYPGDPASCPDISRIINERHTKRIVDMLDDDKITVEYGGQYAVAKNFIEPTIVRAKPDAKCMQHEIFGPILPILVVPSLDDAIDFINSRDKPLGLYVFSEDSAEQKKVLRNTSSGAAAVNDLVVQCGNPALPFGGVGESGMGAYHGKHGFTSFSHMKAVFHKYGGRDPSLRYAPYTESKMKWFRLLRKVDSALLVKIGLSTLVVACLLTAGLVSWKYAL